MRLVTSKVSLPAPPLPVAAASGTAIAAVEFPVTEFPETEVTAPEQLTAAGLRLTFSLEESRKLTWLTAWPLATCK